MWPDRKHTEFIQQNIVKWPIKCVWIRSKIWEPEYVTGTSTLLRTKRKELIWLLMHLLTASPRARSHSTQHPSTCTISNRQPPTHPVALFLLVVYYLVDHYDISSQTLNILAMKFIYIFRGRVITLDHFNRWPHHQIHRHTVRHEPESQSRHTPPTALAAHAGSGCGEGPPTQPEPSNAVIRRHTLPTLSMRSYAVIRRQRRHTPSQTPSNV